MDWSSVGDWLKLVLAGGLLAGLVALYLGRKEAEDRRTTIAMQQRKDAREESGGKRAAAQAACQEALEWLKQLSSDIHLTETRLRGLTDLRARQEALGEVRPELAATPSEQGRLLAALQGHDLTQEAYSFASASTAGIVALGAVKNSSDEAAVARVVAEFDRAHWEAAEVLVARIATLA